MPLPYLNPASKVEVPAAVFSPATERIIARISSYKSAGRKSPERTAYLFAQDTGAVAAGEDYTLKTIIESAFDNIRREEHQLTAPEALVKHQQEGHEG